MERESVTTRLVRFAIDTPLEAIPPQLFDTVRERFLDTVGVAMAGTAFPATATAVAVAQEEGGSPRATVWGWGFKTSVGQAGLINGISAHSPDYDDLTLVPMNHHSVVLVPAVLTLAEAIGASGKETLAAYIMGYEVEAKIGLAVMPEHLMLGWHPPCTLGILATAVAAARLLGATVNQGRAALGIAASEASGIRKNVGTMTKGFHAGHAVQCGLHAAQLAVRGFTADLDVLDSRPGKGHDHYSFQETFNPGVDRLGEVVTTLGDPWELSLPNITVKRHPGATSPAGIIDALADLSRRENLSPDQVEEVRLGVNPILAVIAHYPTARTGLDARYSLRYSAAVAIADRQAGLHQYTDAHVQDPMLQSLLQRIHIYEAPELQHITDPMDQSFAFIDVQCLDGRTFHLETGHARGFPQDPITADELVDKFLECADFGGYTPQQAKHIQGLVEGLDRLSSVEGLATALGRRG